MVKKLELEPSYVTCGKRKRVNAMAMAKEIHDVEGTVNGIRAQNWFRRLKEGDSIREDKSKSWRPSVVGGEALLGMVEQQPNTSICTLSAKFDLLQITINRHLHKLSLVNRCCQQDPHELTNDQAQQRANICN
ncbi:uncharacterized protein LOC115228283 [Octopus sinensis]|uniref:Uncharacterized protein LOC115228283 n=1 Tax=Octopus sinensis TaxID=2607531 RepID=A0A6P7TSK9_9MOLL|nr:uncharacterized protein LOC115228283 [Octopus sinensis]